MYDVCIPQLETFHNSCMSRMMGRYQDLGGPSTTKLLDATGQVPIPTPQPRPFMFFSLRAMLLRPYQGVRDQWSVIIDHWTMPTKATASCTKP